MHGAAIHLRAGARGPTPQVAGTGSYPLEWTSKGPGSNLEGGLVGGGRSKSEARCRNQLFEVASVHGPHDGENFRKSLKPEYPKVFQPF